MRSNGIRVPGVSAELNYNEKKVKAGKAERIYAGNFVKEASELGKSEIKGRLENIMELNQRVEKRGTNITLSFSPNDKLDNEKLVAVAKDFRQHQYPPRRQSYPSTVFWWPPSGAGTYSH